MNTGKLFTPRLWLSEPRCYVFWSMLVGASIGATISWWINQPPTPWLEFEHLSATYRLGALEIDVAGVYRVNKLCDHNEFLPVWRTEAIATDGQIAIYAPYPISPPLNVLGEHSYILPLKLVQSIDPDGWRVRATVSCGTLMPDQIISPSVLVVVLDEIDDNAPPWPRPYPRDNR